MIRHYTIILILSLHIAVPMGAQSYIVRNNYDSQLDFINSSANELKGNVASLDSFFEQLYRLKSEEGSNNSQISVFHLGDSHLQAGFLNGTVMQDFHKDFGNAGRGLIFPLKLANTNEPFDYSITSTSTWRSARCTSIRIPFPLGVGGLSLFTTEDNFDLDIRTSTRRQPSYEFNRVKVFHHPNSPPLVVSGSGVKVKSKSTNKSFVSEFVFENQVNEFTLRGSKENPNDSAIFYGVSLENGRPGVLYHTVGLNGAQFIHYLRIDSFAEQINAVNPQLIIFSLGTNEAFRGEIREAQIRREIDRLVQHIRQKNPEALFLFITPAECQYRVVENNVTVYRPNPRIRIVRDAIINYANENHYAYWDIYDISGGEGSSESWVRNKLLSRDRVHFEVAGYRIQGNLLYQAIVKGYNNYVVKRNK